MTDRELMQMANRIEALAFEMKAPNAHTPQFVMLANEIRARARLAQPEPEPVAWMYQHEDTGLTMCVVVQQVEPGFEKNNPRWQKSTPLYTAPPHFLDPAKVARSLSAKEDNNDKLQLRNAAANLD